MIIPHEIACCTNPIQLYSGQRICGNHDDHRIYRKYLLKSIESWYERIVKRKYLSKFRKIKSTELIVEYSEAMAVVIADAFADWWFEKPDTFEILNLVAVIVELENKK